MNSPSNSMAESPYKGLMPYSEEDAAFFFGRESEQKIIIANLLASRLTVLYGKSGVGKSSVLRAGVSHALRQSAMESISESGKPEHVAVVFSSWRDDPLVGLKKRVEDSVCQALGVDKIDHDLRSVSLVETLKAWTEYIDGNLLIILDQFEDYFLYQRQEMHEDTFAVEFPRAINNLDLRANFLISIREDALAKLDHFKGYIPSLFDNYLRIKHIDSTSARAAVEKPIEHYNRLQEKGGRQVTIESALVDEVLQQVQAGRVRAREVGSGVVEADAIHLPGEDKIEAPYLQLVLVRLWNEEKREGSDVLRVETLNRLGGAERIVQTHLDSVLSRLSETEQETAARVFYHLVTPSGTKIAHTLSDLSDFAATDPERLGQLLEKLAEPEIRILRPIASPPDTVSSVRYEIFHDVLATAILNWRTRYTQARERAETKKLIAQERRRVRMYKWGAVTFLVLSVLVASLAAYAFYQKGLVEKVQIKAKVNNMLGYLNKKQAQGKRDELTALMARAAYKLSHEGDLQMLMSQTDDALRTILKSPYFCHILKKHNGAVYQVAFDPKGRFLASASDDKTIRLWNLEDLNSFLAILEDHGSPVMSLAFSPDGAKLASADVDGTILIWDLGAFDAKPRSIKAHKGEVLSLTFSSDGNSLASAGDDRIVRVWNLKTSDIEHQDLKGHRDRVRSLALSPDGNILASASDDKTIILWDLQNSNSRLETIEVPEISSSSLAFSPDGKILASAGEDKKIRLWNLEDLNAYPKVLYGHTDVVNSVAFNPDGQILASASDDKTIRLWDIDNSSRDPVILEGHDYWVMTLTFDPDGKRLVSASYDGSLRLWDLEAPKMDRILLKGHTGSVNAIAFDPNGEKLASGGQDRIIRIWNVQNPSLEPKTLKGHTDGIWSVIFSPDGNTLISASDDKTIHIWDLEKPDSPLKVLEDHGGCIWSVALSPDGSTLASAGEDTNIRIWNMGDLDADPEILEGHTKWIYSVVFSPDGKILASAGEDEKIWLWDLKNPKLNHEILNEHKGIVTSLAFSQDGTILASASDDETIRLWDIDYLKASPRPPIEYKKVYSVAFSPETEVLTLALGETDGFIRLIDLTRMDIKPIVLKGHNEWVKNVVFSPDGKTLVSSSDDTESNLVMWTLSTELLADKVCELVWHNLGSEELAQFLGINEASETMCPELPSESHHIEIY